MFPQNPMENATPASNEFQAPNILFISIPPSERIFQAQNCTSCHEGASLQGLGKSSHPHGFSERIWYLTTQDVTSHKFAGLLIEKTGIPD